MEILEAYDLTGSYRAAAALVGCDHHTVRRYVQLRASGNPVPEQVVRPRIQRRARAMCNVGARQQGIAHVVDQDQDLERVDRA